MQDDELRVSKVYVAHQDGSMTIRVNPSMPAQETLCD